MKIEDHTRGPTTFEHLLTGDVFRAREQVFLRLSSPERAVSLTSNEINMFRHSEPVVVLKARLVIDGY